MITYDLNSLIHKAIAAGFAAATVGGGAMLLNLSRNDAVQEQKIITIEGAIQKIDAISAVVNDTNRKVDVLNQKLDDAKEQIVRHK